ncbi:MAG: Ig-like domain-containing protein [Candidatus Eremiobacteraeota bacterium]|nr:Ig-like domain-containing protein [Candidatus Eremiobacteraeota bacterium]
MPGLGLLAFLLSAFAAGCGGGGGGGSSPSAPGNPAPTATAQPAPSSSSTAAGVGITISIPTAAPIVFAPTSLAFSGLGQTLTSTPSEQGYGGTFTAVSSNPSVATVSVGTTLSNANFVSVTSVGHGNATINLTSGNGGTGQLPVSVP